MRDGKTGRTHAQYNTVRVTTSTFEADADQNGGKKWNVHQRCQENVADFKDFKKVLRSEEGQELRKSTRS